MSAMNKKEKCEAEACFVVPFLTPDRKVLPSNGFPTYYFSVNNKTTTQSGKSNSTHMINDP